MKRTLLTLGVLIVATAAWYTLSQGYKDIQGLGNKPDTSSASLGDIREISTYKYTEGFVHSGGDFSFRYPLGFVVASVPNESGESIVVQNTEKKIGVQILVTPFEGADADITADLIQGNVPDLKIFESQKILIGADREGLAFLSDNDAFDGASREVWFAFRGKLYQISTYANQDEFLKGLFDTWKFL